MLLGACDNDLIYDIRCARSSDPRPRRARAAAGRARLRRRRSRCHAAAPIRSRCPRSLRQPAGAHRGLQSRHARGRARNRRQRLAARRSRARSRRRPRCNSSTSCSSRPTTSAATSGAAFLGAIKFRYTMWALMAAFLFSFDKLSTGITGLAIILVVLTIFVRGRVHASRAHRRSWHRKYLDYRALAEALRVDYFWEVTGVRRRFRRRIRPRELPAEAGHATSNGSARRCAQSACAWRCRPAAPRPQASTGDHAGWIGDDDSGRAAAAAELLP